jgi:hypothetical protein
LCLASLAGMLIVLERVLIPGASEVVKFTLTQSRWLRAIEALCKMVNYAAEKLRSTSDGRPHDDSTLVGLPRI